MAAPSSPWAGCPSPPPPEGRAGLCSVVRLRASKPGLLDLHCSSGFGDTGVDTENMDDKESVDFHRGFGGGKFTEISQGNKIRGFGETNGMRNTDNNSYRGLIELDVLCQKARNLKTIDTA